MTESSQPPVPTPESAGIVQSSQAAMEFLQGATAVASLMEPFVRQQAQAEVEKTKIQYEAQQHTIDVQADFAKHLINERQTRFKWIAAIATLFGVLVFGLAATLVFLGDKTAGLLVITHAFAAVLGIFGGQGLAKKSLFESSGTDNNS